MKEKINEKRYQNPGYVEDPYVDQTDTNKTSQYTYDLNQNTQYYPVINKNENQNLYPVYPITTSQQNNNPIDQTQTEENKNTENCSATPCKSIFKRRFGQLLFAFGAILFLSCLFINLLVTPRAFPWSFYPCLTILFFGMLLKGTCKKENKCLYLHKIWVGYINLLLIVTNIKTGGFPWSVYIIGVSLPLLIIHKLINTKQLNLFTVHTLIFLTFEFLWLFTCTAFTDPSIRLIWFSVPCSIWATFYAIHLFFHLRRIRNEENQTFSQTQDRMALGLGLDLCQSARSDTKQNQRILKLQLQSK